MQSLLYGLIAALTWGLHDFCVRHLSQKLAVAAMLLAVLSLGSVALIAVITLTGSWAQIDARSAMFAIASGSCYVFGCVGRCWGTLSILEQSARQIGSSV